MRGGQVEVLARSAFLRYREALGEDIGEIPAGLYPGDYLKPIGEALAKKHGRDAARDAGERTGCRSCATPPSTALLDEIKDDLAALNVRSRRASSRSVR